MPRAIVLVCLLLQQTQVVTPPPAPAQTPAAAPSRASLVTRAAEAPLGNLSIIYYDDAYLFVARAFVEQREGATAGSSPGLFVHSKDKDRWLEITAVSTLGARLGRSWSDDPQIQRRIRTVPFAWDFTPFASRPYIDLPLRTSASIAFPDKIALDVATDQYELKFFSSYGAPTAETVLYVKRADLLNAFAGRK